MLVFGGAGGRNNEARLQVDGLNTGAAFNGAGVSSYVPDIGNAQEISTTTSGGLGEAEVGGPSFSIVPKTGGNSIKGSFYASGVTSGMVGSNYTDALKAAGLHDAAALEKLWDYNGARRRPDQEGQGVVLRPVPRRGQPPHGARHVREREFRRPHEVDSTRPTPTRPAVQAGSWRNGASRVTVQPTPRNKFNVFWDEQHPVSGRGVPGDRRRLPPVGAERNHLRRARVRPTRRAARRPRPRPARI